MDGPTPILWSKLVSMVRRRASSASEAEDLVQEAYLRLAERSRGAPVRNPEGFVFRTAVNLAVSDHRAATRHGKAHADHAIAALLQPQAASQHEVIAARERLRLVEQAIGELPPRAREVFLLHRVEGLKYSEIARSLEISVSAVEKHMARALTHLANRLVEFGRKSRDPEG